MTPARLTGSAGGSEAGFTLLEMLVAMTLLGLLTVMLAAGLRTGTRVWERGESLSAGMDDVRLVQAFLRRGLAAAYPLSLTSDRARGAVDFEGRVDRLTFLGPAPEALARGGRARVTVAAVAARDGIQLVMTMQPELGGGATSAAVPTDALLSRLSGVTFSYYGDTERPNEPGWHDRWIERGALPQLVRVQVQFPRGDPRRWPELVVRPLVFADATCGYDPLTKSCRGRP